MTLWGDEVRVAYQFNPKHMDRLLDSGRREWNDPATILSYLALGEGSLVADVGCGPGWFSLEAAGQVGPNGLVYGVDISQEMLDRLMARALDQGLTNVKPVLAEAPDEWPLPTESCDAVLVVNVYHENDPASMFMDEVKRILKPGGTCLVVDWKPEPTPMGPPQAERIDPGDVVQEFEAAGFHSQGPCQVGPYHYGLRFRKPGDSD